MKYDVFVVDSEDDARREILRELAAMPSLVATEARDLAQALATIDRDRPDLLLTDIELSDGSGLDLLAELRHRGWSIPVVVTTSRRADFEDRIRREGLFVLEKPVAASTLRRVVSAKLDQATQVSGESPFELTDYLQLASLGRTSARFEVDLENGDHGGLEVVDGEIWNAWSGEQSGRQAVAHLLSSPCRRVVPTRLEPPPQDRGIHGSMESLLLDLAAERDESARDRKSVAPRPAKPAQGPIDASDADRELCLEVMREAPKALSCRSLRLSTGELLASRPLDADDNETELRSALEVMRAREPLTQSGGPVDELLVSRRTGLQLLKRAPGDRVVALTTGRGAKAGLAWMAVRRAVAAFEPELEGDAAGSTEDDAAARAPACACEKDLDLECGRIAVGIGGARYCAVVQLRPLSIRGASHAGASELRGELFRRTIEILDPELALDPDRRPVEVAVAAQERIYLFSALPTPGWWAVLVADHTQRAAVLRLAFRDALPELASRVEVSASSETVR